MKIKLCVDAQLLQPRWDVPSIYLSLSLPLFLLCPSLSTL
jgi:hypothetical protein